MDLLENFEAADNILWDREQSDDIQRAAMVVLLAHGRYLPPGVKNYLKTHVDEKMCMLLLHSGLHIFGDAHPAILDNEKIILTALQYHPSDFMCASERIRANRSMVLNAVQRRGWLLQYASKELRDDFEVVKVAVTQNAVALRYASEKLRKNRELAILALNNTSHWGTVYEHLPYDLINNDDELALLAIQRGEREVLAFVPDRLRYSRQFVLIAVGTDSHNLQFAPPQFQDDEEIVMKAILESNNPYAIEHASPRLKDDQRIVEAAIKRDPDNLLYASKRLQNLLMT